MSAKALQARRCFFIGKKQSLGNELVSTHIKPRCLQLLHKFVTPCAIRRVRLVKHAGNVRGNFTLLIPINRIKGNHIFTALI